MRVIFLNDTSAWYHWGCTGTSMAIKEEIQFLGFELRTISIDEMYRCQSIPENIEDFSSEKSFKTFSKHNSFFIQQMEWADIILLNGEGTLHGLSHGAKTTLYLVYLSKRFLKKNVQIINHSVYPEEFSISYSSPTFNFYQKVYQHLDYIAIREPVSATIMKQLNLTITSSFDCLPLYIKTHYNSNKKSSAKNTIVIGGSGAWFKQNTFEKYQPNLIQLVDYLYYMQRKGYVLEVLVGAKAYPARDDHEFIDYLEKHKKLKCKIVNAKNITEWLETIENATLLVSGRFHYTIAAVCLKTPYIVFGSNTPKIEGLLKFLKTGPVFSYTSSHLLGDLITKTEDIMQHPEQFFTYSIDELCQFAKFNFTGLYNLKCVPSNQPKLSFRPVL